MVIFEKLAPLFDYPGKDYFERVNELDSLIDKSYTSHYLSWIVNSQKLKNIQIGELQERFISSFDVKANSSLDVGHMLFGEDKKRNNFLIHLREEHLKIQHDCGSEMPDYLPNLLMLLSVSDDEVFNEEIAMSIILPSLRLMKSGLDSKENPYSGLFNLLIDIIVQKYPDSVYTEYIPVAKKICNPSKSHCHHG